MSEVAAPAACCLALHNPSPVGLPANSKPALCSIAVAAASLALPACPPAALQGNEAFRDGDYPAAYELYTKVSLHAG